MPRIQRVGKGLSEFKQIMLDPGDMDAALPAPMDITVLSHPEAISAEHVAMIAMGLRLGYAHYNDWTTLPAPLFFRRKIEDYIIRFPEDDDAIEAESPDDAQPVLSATGKQSELLLFEDEGSDKYAETESATQELPDISSAKAPTSSDRDLLSSAKSTCMPALAFSPDLGEKRLYKRMVQDARGEVQVHVTLPYWLNTQGLFGPFSPIVRRNSSRVWRRLREFDYVKNKASKPKDSELLNWMAERLRTPQAVRAMVLVSGDIGGLALEPLVTLVEDVYNVGRSSEDRVDPRRWTPDMLRAVAEWANSQQNDELLAWLVFLVAQFPAPEWTDAVIQAITAVPGPMTEDRSTTTLTAQWQLRQRFFKKTI